MIFNLILILVYQLQEDISAQDDNICGNLNGALICCSGYYLFDDRCIECFGAYGENCSKPCAKNSYGYNCKETCNCTENKVCNKYLGCQQSCSCNTKKKDCGESGILVLVIGLGSVTLSASLVFVGIMFCRWRIHLQRTFKISEDNTSGKI
ncbi:protein draper-like isoform X4 [Saccostrea cucullata]|uniref:protein draper-like isoform X4 n=1 Tax=Saccostrea cuccullata TaxID=36930 RepID=UPI002ED49BA5